MQDTVLGIRSITGGLSNQRLMMLGLLAIAKERKILARFPSQMVDYVPRLGDSHRERFFFSDLFDIAQFRKATRDEPVTTKVPNSWITAAEALPRGFQMCMNSPDPFVSKFMLGLVAAAPLQAIADEIAEWLAPRNAIALQLRIERDWQEYLARLINKGRAQETDRETVDPRRIFQKMRSGLEQKSTCAVWACCDEDDLLLSKFELKEIASSYDFDLIFKTDLPESIILPKPLLHRSMVDYAVCARLGIYVGLTRSTFSRTLRMMARWSDSPARHYSYDTPDDQIKPL